MTMSEYAPSFRNGSLTEMEKVEQDQGQYVSENDVLDTSSFLVDSATELDSTVASDPGDTDKNSTGADGSRNSSVVEATLVPKISENYADGSLAESNSPQEVKKNIPFREGSPFKEAIKGFVRSKLTKKPAAPESTPLPGERRTLFSGLKEKIARRLEDSSAKDTLTVTEEFQSLSAKSHSASELDVIQQQHECELKSVVANDQEPGGGGGGGVPNIVEEAEECFEEPKGRIPIDNISVEDVFPGSHSSALATPPRSRTLSNISGASHVFKSKSKPAIEKDISISFSDLQKADDLNGNCAGLDEEGETLSLQEEQDVSSGMCSSPPSNAGTLQYEELAASPAMDEAPGERTQPVHESIFKKIYIRFCNVCRWCLQIHVVVLIGAIVVYRIFNSWPFVAGILCTLLVLGYVSLLYYDFTVFLMQKCSTHFPEYKTLPELSSSVPESEICTCQGWMNQLLSDFNPDTYSLQNTVSVFVTIEGNRLTLSYPKKDIPKRAMWNEKPLCNTLFVRHERHFLNRARVLLLPEDLPKTRTWNKRYPLCIMLPERRRSPSVDSACKESEVEKPKGSESNLSLPPSLSGSPSRGQPKENLIYLFARTDREKEEWFRVFSNAVDEETADRQSIKVLQVDASTADNISIISIPPIPTPSASSLSKSSVPDGKEESISVKPLMPQKPVLNFEHYMTLLLEQCKKGEESEQHTSIQWLNVLLGRIFYDFLVQKKWAENVQQRIQNKLDRIKMPQYMQKLVVTDVYLGRSLPQIRKTSQPVMDKRGLWVDLEIEYEGYFQMTLETKFKSLQPAKMLYEKSEDFIEPGAAYNSKEHTFPANDDLSELYEEEEEAQDVDSPKEESPSHTASVSTGVKLLQSVERWVTSSNLVDNRFVKRCVGHLTQARLLLTVEVNSLNGVIALNIPPLPTDRLWYGFRRNPDKLSLNVFPKVGDRNISLLPVVQLIKRKLLLEFQKALVMPNMDDVMIPLMNSGLGNSS